jgi:hypothetical protein
MVRRGAIVAAVLALVVVALPPAGRAQAQVDCFAESGFCIDHPAFQEYFRLRGGVRTFGYPISRQFRFLGFPVQFFQGQVMQLRPDGRVVTLNLLEEGLMPATRINGSVFPPADAALLAEAPRVGDPAYADRIVDFTRANAPNEWGGWPVRFFDTFMGTVDLATAFPGGGGDRALLPLLNLEIWGAATSRPTADPANPNFVYQRYQRAIMHYRAECGCTERILLADWFKSVITGSNLPSDLEQQARADDSPFLFQYCPGAERWLCQPQRLPDTDLTLAFEPLGG